MTLLEKVMRKMNDTRSLDKFIEETCVFNYDCIDKHFDGSRAVELCSTKMRAYDKCTNCENSFVVISKPRSNICFCPHCGKRVELEIPF